MSASELFNESLIRRYNISGPRYTSYPTAVEFSETFTTDDYLTQVEQSNASGKPLSLYLHIPFCDTVCYYCACNKIITNNRRHAEPYLASLHREIAMQAALFDRNRQVQQLHWGGGTPTFINAEQMTELMAVTRQHFNLAADDSADFSIEIDPREADPQRIELLRQLGFNRLSLGVQDFDPQVQQAVNRIQSEQQTLSILDAARDNGFKSISIDLIYGLPHQTVTSFRKTLDKIIKAQPDRLSVFNYAHLPARFKTQRQIRSEDLPSANEKLDILYQSIDQLTEAGYVYIGMDHFAKPDDELAIAQRAGRLHRNFQGYSTHGDCDLIGLGMTSIGSVADAYIQNQRELGLYQQQVNADQLPVMRGYLLSRDDKVRRTVITRLICDFALDIEAIENQLGYDFFSYFVDALPALRQFSNDKLLEFDEKHIRVLAAGRLLIRNICMAFDRYSLQHQQSRFSKAI
ncbi:MAG: oxygen-independent coproporphyrinogen III oxidase [Methylophaga sp.]|nr:oxygen-independent coproporphyrinogen III oxidase [Methylophaga sp.]